MTAGEGEAESVLSEDSTEFLGVESFENVKAIV
jgi:hypothetical protein